MLCVSVSFRLPEVDPPILRERAIDSETVEREETESGKKKAHS
jgi:hypothetical protein